MCFGYVITEDPLPGKLANRHAQTCTARLLYSNHALPLFCPYSEVPSFSLPVERDSCSTFTSIGIMLGEVGPKYRFVPSLYFVAHALDLAQKQ